MTGPFDPERPVTNYDGSEEVACPQCGEVRPPGFEGQTLCQPCFNTGHKYRLVNRAEMIYQAEKWEKLGYYEAAQRMYGFAVEMEDEGS